MARRGTASAARRVVLSAAATVLVAGLAGACQPPAAALLSDPREVLAGTITSAARLRTASLRMDFEQRDHAQPALGIEELLTGGSVVGAADFRAGSWSMEVTDRDGLQQLSAIVVGDTSYMQSPVSPGGRWMASEWEGGFLPIFALTFGLMGTGNADFGGIVRDALAGDSVRAELRGVDQCGPSRCYRVGFDVPADAAWPLVARLSGLDRIPDAEPDPADRPTLSAAFTADVIDLHPVDVDVRITTRSNTMKVRVALEEVNVPVSIEAPPAHLVDRPGDSLGGVGRPAGAGPDPVPAGKAEPEAPAGG